MAIGFNIIGLAYNHRYDFLSSPEDKVTSQPYGHVARLKQGLQTRGAAALFSGVFKSPDSESPDLMMPVAKGQVAQRLCWYRCNPLSPYGL